MITNDVLLKVKEIEIHARRLLSGALVGDTRSTIKGSGFDFDQIREYQMGDDVRFIDWNSSARMNKLLIKQHFEERNRTVLLLVDISASHRFASSGTIKSDLVAQIASILALVANYGSDYVSLILLSDDVELFIPPAKGHHHVRHIMENLFGYDAKSKKTSICTGLEYLAKLQRKDGIVFIISDFIDRDFDKPLSIVSRMYDVIAVHCFDANESFFPSVGFVPLENSETGQTTLLDVRSKACAQVNDFLQQRLAEQNLLFKKYDVDCLAIANSRPFIGDLVRFFRRRMRY